MSNDVDLYGNNDLAPYSPGGDLQTLSPDDWGTPDQLSDFSPQTDMQPGMEQAFAQIGQVISGDMLKLGHPVHLVNSALNWFAQNMGTDPGRVQRRHSFNLFRHKGDGLAESFGNHCAQIGASQEFVSNCLYFLEQMEKRLTGNAQQVQHAPAASGQSAQDIMDSLNDRDYDFVVRHNQNVASQTEAYLRGKWGDSYLSNLATANAYLANLPESHRAHFEQFEPGTWTLALNSASTIEGLFTNAIGGHNLPTGSGLSSEIASIENLMRTNRAAYNKDPQLQARLRTLYDMRGR